MDNEIQVISDATFFDSDPAYTDIDGFLVRVINFRILDPELYYAWDKAFMSRPERDEFIMWENWQDRLRKQDDDKRRWIGRVKDMLGIQTEGGSITQDVGEIFTGVFFEEVGKREKTDRFP